MRTTLTLDDDLAEALRALAARDRTSFKETVNTVLRRGLTAQETRRRRKRFRVNVFDGPLRPGVDPLRLNQASDDLEVERASDRIVATGAS
jgi:plasmid stability protein